ncbi:anhydro-N-acetylmuramic acid kinase [Herbiconiux sp. YIM B11900]|uniref:anhydro-N-acetylmuramic acid kinase n=1 Tax=Herbiconiux sp. YIM B11900 TaxID=3404131 RepID=UPI003F87A6B8
MRTLGMISGTSHDGIDVAVVDFEFLDGGALAGVLVHSTSVPYRPELRARILAALPPASTTLAEMAELDTLIGQAFAEAAATVCAGLDAPVDVITSHGQTVFHWVQGGRALGTLQIGQPAWIAEATGVPVVSDVRIRDIAAGGQGAPLVSFLDELLLRAAPGRTAALNLGGISNMTVVEGPDDAAGGSIAYDIGPANSLIDAVVVTRGAHPSGFDVDGRIAAAGTVDAELLELLLAEPYYRLPAPKSTGKELFNAAYVDSALETLGRDVGTADLVSTLTELTAATVAQDVSAHGVETLVVSGGGWRNRELISRLAARLPAVSLVASDDFGAPTDDKEAIAFALIGWCTLHGVPSTVPTATGAREARILGTITPGTGALRLPEPVVGALTGLTLRSGTVPTPEGR